MRLDTFERLAARHSPGATRREVLAAGGLAALVLAGCGGGDDDGGSSTATGKKGVAGGGKPVDTVNWGIVADPAGLDPIGPNDYQSVQPMYQCYDTILQLNEQNGISPMIAEDWEQADPTTYIYDIREGVTFQDGSPMTVEDVAYSIQRHVDPANGSALVDFVSSVRSVTTNGNNQVIVKLKEPDAMWKYIPCLPVGMVVSKKNIEKLKKSGATIGSPDALPLGTGPFKFVSWKRGQTVNMQRYDGYWDKSKALKVENLKFQVVSDAEALATGMLDGSIQGTFQLNGQQVTPLEGQVQVISSESVNVRMAAFNCAKAPFDDPLVRQAISLAIDKKGLLDSTFAGKGKLWNSPVMSNQWQFAKPVFQDAYDSLPDYMTQNMDKAKQLIEQTQAQGATGNIIASTTEQVAQATEIQSRAKELGLNLTVDRVSGDELIAQLFPESPPHQWSMACWDWGSDTPDPSSNLFFPFLSTNLSDFTEYKNAKVDKLLAKQKKMMDGKARANVLAEIQAQVVADQPWSVLYWITQLTVLANGLGGLAPIPTWAYQHWAADLSGT
ncbi:MAG: ABC transporter substrate-binding protein [Solirubrobacterales bacterium]|nr:ABC transporter substrate-binding protein [Solirubrobacterales bacterium]